MQSDTFTQPVYKGWEMLRKVTLAELCHGYWPGLLKSFPTNAATFMAYELVGKQLEKK